ncbi:hypothetical protein IWW46_006431, partial [Coemansia sp. RSA 2440]
GTSSSRLHNIRLRSSWHSNRSTLRICRASMRHKVLVKMHRASIQHKAMFKTRRTSIQHKELFRTRRTSTRSSRCSSILASSNSIRDSNPHS